MYRPLPRRYLLVLWTFALSVLLYVDRICVSTAKDAIAGDLSLDDRQMGWILSAFALGYALFQTPGGWLVDRLGARRVLTGLVLFWSVFTGLTALAWNLPSMLATRFLFGAGEAGAYPGLARVTYSWIPMDERGLVQGINVSGSRVGGAASLVVIPAMIEQIGWKSSFALLMVIGCIWALGWYLWFRDDPAALPGISPDEVAHIVGHRQPRAPAEDESNASASVNKHPTETAAPSPLSIAQVLSSANVQLISFQYFCSNFSFFFCLTWLFPHMKATYHLTGLEAGLYSAAPLVCAAIGNWTSGWLVDRIYRAGRWPESRRSPAIIGFLFGVVGLIASVRAETPLSSIAWFSLAIFGTDMTIAPSWAFCIDIGKAHAGFVSGTMNMAGNLGSFVTALAFPYLAAWTGSNTPFFYVAAGLSLVGVAIWTQVDPRIPLLEGT